MILCIFQSRFGNFNAGVQVFFKILQRLPRRPHLAAFHVLQAGLKCGNGLQPLKAVQHIL